MKFTKREKQTRKTIKKFRISDLERTSVLIFSKNFLQKRYYKVEFGTLYNI